MIYTLSMALYDANLLGSKLLLTTRIKGLVEDASEVRVHCSHWCVTLGCAFVGGTSAAQFDRIGSAPR